MPAFAAALILFVIYAANVARGAFGAGVYFGDIFEMLLLFAAVIFFVIGILAREAAERPRDI